MRVYDVSLVFSFFKQFIFSSRVVRSNLADDLRSFFDSRQFFHRPPRQVLPRHPPHLLLPGGRARPLLDSGAFLDSRPRRPRLVLCLLQLGLRTVHRAQPQPCLAGISGELFSTCENSSRLLINFSQVFSELYSGGDTAAGMALLGSGEAVSACVLFGLGDFTAPAAKILLTAVFGVLGAIMCHRAWSMKDKNEKRFYKRRRSL